MKGFFKKVGQFLLKAALTAAEVVLTAVEIAVGVVTLVVGQIRDRFIEPGWNFTQGMAI